MYKLLIVDDEDLIRQGLINMIPFGELNLTLTGSCSNAFSAMSSMTDDMPDILLTDIRMPGMDGLELVNRAINMCPKLQVVIISGFDTFQYAQQAIKLGVKEYLLKPCNSTEVTQAIKRAIDGVDVTRREAESIYSARQKKIAALCQNIRELISMSPNQEEFAARAGELLCSADDEGIARNAMSQVIGKSAAAMKSHWASAALSHFSGNGEIMTGGKISDKTRDYLLKLKLAEENDRTFVEEMTAYADSHFSDETLSLQFLADNVVYMSADYIGREFAKTTGQKFSAYLLRVRMEEAKHLLTTQKNMHTYEIAERVGLGSNPHYFSQVFRKYTGMTPKEYKNKE